MLRTLSLLSLLCVTAAVEAQFLRGNQHLFGSTLSQGDVDGDGKLDLLVGTPVNKYESGKFQAFSVPSGKQIVAYGGAALGFGLNVAAIGDTNKDGRDEFVVGAIDIAYVMSTKLGILKILGGTKGSSYGTAVARAGDVDRDGHADYMIGGSGDSKNAFEAGLAEVRSGKDHKVLFTFRGKQRLERLGRALASAGDVNKDGYPDFAVGSPGLRVVQIFSGKDGKLIRRHTESAVQFGFAIDGGHDLNGDGYPELAVGAPDILSAGAAPGAFIYSGKDGKRLYAYTGPKRSWFGYSLTIAGDLDLDQVNDIVIGVPAVSNVDGRVMVYSGKDGKLLSRRDGPTLSSLGTAVIANSKWFAVSAPTLDLGVIQILPGNKPALLQHFGTACGKSPPTLHADAPQMGLTMRVDVRNLKPPTFGVLIYGTSNKSWRGTSLPMKLDYLGMPGCALYTSWDLEIPFFTGTTTHSTTFPVRWDPSDFYFQAWAWQKNATPAHIQSTRAAHARVGF